MDIVIDEKEFCNLVSSSIDLDITFERPVCFDYPNFPFKDEQGDYYEEFQEAGDVFDSFTTVLVRMYINYVLKCLFELDMTIEDKKALIETVYTLPLI